jgi:hypothetical protein
VCGYREQRREKEEKRRKREGVRWEEAGREEK